MLISPKYPWTDPSVLKFPTTPANCVVSLQLPDDNYVRLSGTVTAIETDPAGAYAFSGTSLELIKAVLAPEPRGVQDARLTCGNFVASRSTTKPGTTTPSS
jgi:hypothetical protein